MSEQSLKMNLHIFKKSKKLHENLNNDSIECSSDKLGDTLNFLGNKTITFNGRSRLLYPSVNQKITKLPQSLSSQDRSDLIKLSSKNPFQCEYRKRFSDDLHVGSIRTSEAIPEEC